MLPVASQELYLISRGVYQGGKVQVKQSTEQGDVRVDVRVAYHDQRALAHATVCRLHKSGSRDGVGIYVRLDLCIVDPWLISSIVLDAHVGMVQPFSRSTVVRRRVHFSGS